MKSSLDNVTITILLRTMSEDHVAIIKQLSKPKHDEDIASGLDIKATIVRTILNDLHAKSLVEYDRTKNKKTGWYTYLWKKRGDKVEEYVRSYLMGQLSELNEILDKEKNDDVLSCSCGHITLNKAIETNFLCLECNEHYAKYDNSKSMVEVTNKIGEINNLLQKI